MFFDMSRATPEIPIAERRLPIVVGMRQTRSAVRIATVRIFFVPASFVMYDVNG